MPSCPHCEGTGFRRSSMFGELESAEPIGTLPEVPDWLGEARDALVAEGDYLAFDDGERVRVIVLQEGWTRIGRSLSAHIRFDDPTVSRRHALVHRDADGLRILDDRSLNGVFVNGVRVDMSEIEDGDDVSIGRFSLHCIELREGARRATSRDTRVAGPHRVAVG